MSRGTGFITSAPSFRRPFFPAGRAPDHQKGTQKWHGPGAVKVSRFAITAFSETADAALRPRHSVPPPPRIPDLRSGDASGAGKSVPGTRGCRPLCPSLDLQEPPPKPQHPPHQPHPRPAYAVRPVESASPCGRSGIKRTRARIPGAGDPSTCVLRPARIPPVLRTREMLAGRRPPEACSFPRCGRTLASENCRCLPESKAVPGEACHLPCTFGKARCCPRSRLGWTPAVRSLLRWTLRRPGRAGEGKPAGAGCAGGLDALVLAGPLAPARPGWGRVRAPASLGRLAGEGLLASARQAPPLCWPGRRSSNPGTLGGTTNDNAGCRL
jgi:hypothetical protein